MTRAVLYARVSDEKQAREDRNSLEAQRAAFLLRCTEREYVPGETFQDVESGRRVSRPAYQSMLSAARRGEFDTIIVTFLDRFGRDPREILRRVLELEELGVEVDAIHDDTREFITLALTAWRAGEESRRIGERVKMATAGAVRRGVPMGRPAYGYKKLVTVDEDGRRHGYKLVPHPVTAPIVRELYSLYTDGSMSLIQIARRLTLRGTPAPTGGAWTGEGVRHILRRPIYAGDFVWGETVVRNTHEPLVTREVWEEARSRLAVKSTLPGGRTQVSPYLLSGIFYCRHCGNRMEGNSTHPRGHYYRRYRCAKYRKSRACEFPNYQHADRVEGAVVAALSAILGDLDILRDTASTSVTTLADELAAIQERLAGIDARFLRNMRMYDSGVIATEEQLATANRELAEEQKALEVESARLTAAVQDAGERFSSLEVWATRSQSFGAYLGSLDVPAQKALIQGIVERIEIGDGDEAPRITLRVPGT